MRFLLFRGVALTLSVLSLPSPARGAYPCHTEVLKRLRCDVANEESGAMFRVEVIRSRLVARDGAVCVLAGADREFTRGVIMAPGNRISDLYLSSAPDLAPMTHLEGGKPLAVEFYSEGKNTEVEWARAEIMPTGNGFEARVTVKARVASFFQRPGLNRLDVEGSGACRPW